MISLVGYTGFVGSNIYAAGSQHIDKVYNSKNISEAYDTNPDLLIYSGLRAEKYLANTDPESDMKLIYQAQDNITRINPKKLVLISTVDVLKEPKGKDESCEIDTVDLHAYGLNRYRLEQWVRERYEDALIIRLPGLYGINIKKNFIYDYINVIPFMLKEAKFEELCGVDGDLRTYYDLQDNGFYRCKELTDAVSEELKAKFKAIGFTALNFTDSRHVYQFYPLSRLCKDINTALNEGIRLWHPATEPVSAAEVYEYLTGGEAFDNEFAPNTVYYDYRTKYDTVFGGHNGYLMNRQQVLEDIARFVGVR